MRRWWLDLGSLAVALALAAAVVLRWRRGEVALLSSTAAPAIRLLALLIVFVQGCADRLRGREEPDGQGARPAAGAAGQAAPGGGDEAGDSDMSESTGSSQPGLDDMSQGAPGAFPLADEAALARCARLLADDELGPGAAQRLALALAAAVDGAPAHDPAWPQVEARIDALADQAGGPAGEAFRARWRAHVEARRAGRAGTLAEARALLAAIEALPLYHAGLAAHVWRRAAPLAGPASERAELLGRLELHLRTAQALRKGQFEAGPVEFTAWRSKAGPPPGWSGLRVPPGLFAAASRLFAAADAGTWESEGTIALQPAGEGLTLLRRGQATPLPPGRALTLRRLDVILGERPATLRHAELGELSLGTGESLTAWDLGGRLGEAGLALVRARVAAARDGDPGALRQLEAILPAAHLEIRRALAEQPGAPGAPGLRTLLALFDE